jgi:hypothetical protein
MLRLRQTAALAALAAGAQFWSTVAAAHIELQLPMNRYSDAMAGDNKSCPCGSGTANRSCNVVGERSDPNRSTDRATTFAPGDTITVRWDEYVGHSGRFRIAFDPDGADLEDFNQNILLDVADPVGNTGNMGQGSLWEYQVQLPNMTCDNCTLELIQVMDGDMTDPVPDPSVRGGTYFQCADIVLAEGTPAGGIPPANPTDHLGQDLGRNPPPAGAASGNSASGSAGSGSAASNSATTGSAATGSATGATGSTTAVAAMTGTAAAATGGMSLSGASNSASGNLAAATNGMGPDAKEDGGCSFAYASHAAGSQAVGWQVLVGFAGVISLASRRRKRA